MIRIHKCLSLFLVICLAFGIFFLPTALATSPPADPSPSAVETATSEESSAEPEEIKPKVDVSSEYCILIDADTGAVLFEKNAYAQAYPASTTKIMTGLLVCELMESLDEEVEAGPEVNGFSEANITLGIKEYEKVSVEDLLYGMMLASGNDAAIVLAVHFGGSRDGFSALMNAKASELGLENSHFLNPHGLNNEGHYTTAYDLAQITRAALQNETFAKVVATPEYTLQKTNKRKEERVIYNTNRFISSKESAQEYHWSAVTGVKTGHTSAAQGCLVISGSKDGNNLIAVALYDTSKNSQARWDDCEKMLKFGFKELDRLQLDELNFDPLSTTVSNASRKDSDDGLLLMDLDTEDVMISGLRESLSVIRKDPAKLTLVPVINYGKELSAPIQKGQVVGSCTIKYEETILAVVNLVAQRDIASVESDPVNPVSSLVTDVTNGGTRIPTLYWIIGAAVVSLVAALTIFFIVRRRNRHAPRFHSRRRRSGYYNYHHR